MNKAFNYGEPYESEEAQHKAREEIKKAEKSGKEQYVDYLPKTFQESKELIEKEKERKGFRSGKPGEWIIERVNQR